MFPCLLQKALESVREGYSSRWMNEWMDGWMAIKNIFWFGELFSREVDYKFLQKPKINFEYRLYKNPFFALKTAHCAISISLKLVFYGEILILVKLQVTTSFNSWPLSVCLSVSQYVWSINQFFLFSA